jgi:hypothetical protein
VIHAPPPSNDNDDEEQGPRHPDGGDPQYNDGY